MAVDEVPPLHYQVELKGDFYIAKCIEFPGVSVYSENIEDVDGEIKKAIAGYMQVFPEELVRLLSLKEVKVQVPASG